MAQSSPERLICSSCGSAYPLDAVRDHASFSCSICGNIIVVPTSVPGAGAVTRPQRTAARSTSTPSAPAQPAPPSRRPTTAPPAKRRATPSRPIPRRTHDSGKRGSRATKPLVIVAILVLVGITVTAAFILRPKRAPAKEALPTSETVATADPKTDAAAWKALPAAERSRLRRETLDAIDRHNSSQLEWAADFFLDRGETAARDTVARWAIESDPGAQWAHTILGLEDCGKLVDAAFEESPRAEELQTEAIRELESLVARERPGTGPWFPSGEVVGRVRTLVTEVRSDEQRLADDYAFGVTRWTNYQRKIDIMRDFPAIHGTTGPYLIFVQVGGSPKSDLSNVDSVELNRAERVLREMKSLFGSLYEAWHRELGPSLGFTRYGPENAPFATLLKVNAFSREADFERYCQEQHDWSPTSVGVSAFYSRREPRFVVTHDGKVEDGEEEAARRRQCRNGVYQLAQFYTRDLTEKKTGRAPAWPECVVRPMWSSAGFADFFSAHKGEGNTRKWMQPIDKYMELIWILEQGFPRCGWDQLSLSQVTGVASSAGLNAMVLAAAPQLTESQAADERWVKWHGYVQNLYARLFYARSWSLAYFLWHAEEDGQPKYRTRYIEYLKREFVVPGATDDLAADGKWTGDLLLDALGITDAAGLEALDQEWQAWVMALCEQHQDENWLPTRAGLFKTMGVK